MFSIQFCICFYSILYVCHCHFGTIHENCTQKNVIKLETNLDIKNRHEAIISENNTKVKYLAKNASKVNIGITIDNQQHTTKKHKYNSVKIVIQKKIKVTQKKKFINNIDNGLIKKNNSIFGIDLTLYDLVVEKQFVTKKITDDYLENSIDKRNQSELIEDTGELTITKNDTVEERNTIIENQNITENVRNIFQNNSMDKTVPKYELPKNIKNNDMTRNIHKYDSSKNLKQRSELIGDTRAFIIPKNDIVEEQSTMIKNENVIEMDKHVPKYDLSKNIKIEMKNKHHKYDSTISILEIVNSPDFAIPRSDIVEEKTTVIKNDNITENVTKLFQNVGTDKNVQKHFLPNDIENNDMTKNVREYNSPKNVKQLSELIEDTGAFIIPKNDIVEEQSTIIKNENIIENVAKIFPNNEMYKNVPKYDLPKNIKNNDMTKNVHKYDSTISILGIVNSPDFTIPNSDIVEEKTTVIKNENITENVTKIFQNNGMDKNVQNHKSPKNVQKRDIGMPENVTNNYMPEVFHNHGALNDQKYNLHKKNKIYDKPKNIHNNFNEVKSYNYQNDVMNYKNIIYEKDMPIKDKHTRRYNDSASQNVRPQFQTRLNNDLVKKSLDEFKMVRRKTHYTMPDFEFKNDIAQRDIDRYQDLAYPKFREYDNEATLNGARNHVMPDYHVEHTRNNMYPSYSDFDFDIYQSYEDYFKELNKILTRQKKIIRQINKQTTKQPGKKLTEDEKQKRKEEKERRQQEKIRREQDQLDFDVLMSEVKMKQEKHRKMANYTKFTFETTTEKTTTKLTTTAKPTTILTLFDETEVRLALKNDPHVKRILKMANLKREKYLNNVRRYLTDHNYTQTSN